MSSAAAGNLVLGPLSSWSQGLGHEQHSSQGAQEWGREQGPQSLVRGEGAGGEPGGRLCELSPILSSPLGCASRSGRR